jgi:hypothetical protein
MKLPLYIKSREKAMWKEKFIQILFCQNTQAIIGVWIYMDIYVSIAKKG